MDQAIAKPDANAQAGLPALLSRIGGPRQLLLILGIAAVLAVMAGLFFWSQAPAYRVLYSGLSEKDAGQIMEALQKSAIPFKVDSVTGALQVPESQVHEARLKLAAQGLPKGSGVGFEMLDEQQTFGTSQFMETARYQRALETELARSIGTISAVENARVHLALPRHSVFVRDQQPASASVLVQVFPGRLLEQGQVAAIVHLVAASVPQLMPSRVTVLDQTGRLLTRDESSQDMAWSQDQLDYTRRVESSYIKRIEDILSPVIGMGKIRAQVTADIDFTATEQTQELFNPKTPGVRSEQLVDEQSLGTGAEGIPGALSNQPPGPASVPERTAASAAQAGGGQTGSQAAGQSAAQNAAQSPSQPAAGDQKLLRKQRRETRNYELDKTIAHTRLSPGGVKRLSVAVVVDDRVTQDAKGNAVRKPLTQDEITRITALVKEAVGFKAERGDTVNVTNASFVAPPAEPVPEISIWERPWMMELIKLGIAAVVGLALLFGLVMPLVRGLLLKRAPGSVPASAVMLPPGATPPALPPGAHGELADDQVKLSKGMALPQLTSPRNTRPRCRRPRSWWSRTRLAPCKC